MADKRELSQALDTVVEYITDKVTQNIYGQTSEVQQNGFNSINTTAEKMVSTGGKTRKFKLTNKKKTKTKHKK